MPLPLARKENWLCLIRNEQPLWLGDPWDAVRSNNPDSIFLSNPLTTTMTNQVNTAGHLVSAGMSPSDGQRVLDGWRGWLTLSIPDNLDWSAAETFMASIDRHEYLTIGDLGTGVYELACTLLGVEAAHLACIQEPKELFPLLGAIADWQIACLEQLVNHLHPDIICYHDSWGSENSLFLPSGIWRALYKPHLKRVVEVTHSLGAIFMHHADGYCEPLVRDLVLVGVDIWLGASSCNDIVSIQKMARQRMAIIGGIDAARFDRSDCDETALRLEVRRCVDTYCPAGNYIPCFSNGQPRHTNVNQIFLDEMNRYGAEYAKRIFRSATRKINSASILESLKGRQ